MSFPSINHLSEYAIILVSLAVSITVIRIGFQFDINKWLEARKATQEIKLRNMCPHILIGKSGGKPFLQSRFVSPSGTSNWICQQCDMMLYANPGEDYVEYWHNNLPQLLKKQKAFDKQARKMGLIP